MLAENGHIVAHAARQLGMSRQALYRRMEKLGIKESPARQAVHPAIADLDGRQCAWTLVHGRLGHPVARRHRDRWRRPVAPCVAAHVIALALDGGASLPRS